MPDWFKGNQLRFVHFYAGVLKALEVLDDQRLKFLVDVIDTEGAVTT